MTVQGKARRAAREAGNSRFLTVAARAGFAASGLLHLLLGYLAIRVAFHHAGEPDQSGALAQLARLPGGTVALWATVAGFAALGSWLTIQALMGIGSSSKKRWIRSVISAAKAMAYFGLGATALTFALGGSTDAKTSARKASGTLLTLPGGVFLLLLAALATAVIGGYLFVKGARQKFRQDISLPSGVAQKPVLVLGMFGYVAKGVAILAVGVLLAVAAVKVDPSGASGLDGALRSLAELPFGQVILTVVGTGLIAYGAYSFARARLARL